MYDGAVVFDTRLKLKNLEKDYSKAVKKVEKLESDLNGKKEEKTALSKKMEEVGAQADSARQRVKALKSEIASINLEMEPEAAARNPEAYINALARKPVVEAELKEAEKTFAPLEKKADKLAEKFRTSAEAADGVVEKLERQKYEAAEILADIERTTAELKEQEMQTKEVAEKMEEAAAAQNSFSDATDGATVRMDKLLTRIKGLATRVLVFSLITQGLRLMRDWLGEVVTKNDQTAAAIARLKGALLTLAQPLLQVVIPVFTALVNLLTAVIGKIAAFLSMLGGKTVQQSAEAAKALNNQADAYGGVADAAKKAQKQLMGFDEINKLESADASAAGGGGGAASGEIAPDFSWAAGVSEVMEKISGWVLAIAAGLALWKIGSYIPGTLGLILSTLGKIAVAGGLVGLGFTLISEGFKDAAENGFTLKNVLTIIAGILATGLGISVLTGSLLPLLVAGILSVLLAITVVTGRGGELLEGLKKVFEGMLDFFTGVFTGDWEKAWDGIERAAVGACEAIMSVILSIWDLIQSLLPSLADFFSGTMFAAGEVVQMPSTYARTTMPSVPVPHLAQGAVIPPNRKFMAVLGDQKHGTNIEAPLDTIKQAVAEVLAGQGNSETAALLRELIAVVESIEVGDEVIGKAAARYTRKTARARGT